MSVNRRTFTLGSLTAAAGASMPIFAKADDGKTLAIMFDSLESLFWVEGIQVLKDKAKAAGWTPLESISNQDDNKQFEQVQ